MKYTSLTKEDAIFYIDMTKSIKSPNFKPILHSTKPYFKILVDRDSNEYRRFIKVYKAMADILSEREVKILNAIYGVSKKKSTLKETGEMLNISSNRVRQIRNLAEHKIAMKLLNIVKEEKI